MKDLKHNLVRKPVARFYYKGSHKYYPVRRTVLIITSDNHHITGYEIREGSIVRKLAEAPIKTYLKKKIAKTKDLRKDSVLRKKEKSNKSTLNRSYLLDLLTIGA